jgi:isopentenyldiphosphate isomerase
MQEDELFEIVDASGRVIGRARRGEVHGNPALMHRTIHCLVFNRRGECYLQKRGPDKDIQPGKWDSSVGGHLMPGEDVRDAVRRETLEELGIEPGHFEHWDRYVIANAIETELVDAFRTVYEGTLRPDPGEISEGRFWTDGEIEERLGQGIFTPNFIEEWKRYRAKYPRMESGE